VEGSVRKDNSLGVFNKVKRVHFEAFLSQVHRGRAETVLVSTAMVVAHRPSDFGSATSLPYNTSGHRRKISSGHTMVSISGVDIVTSLGNILTPRSTTGKTTSIGNGSTTRSTPWVVLVDVLFTSSRGIAVDTALAWVVDGGFLSRSAQVGLSSTTHVIAFLASDETPL
jgi:hypothetical protein